jgi:hypothetical protein
MLSKRSREGYLLIDHSASPGLPAAIANPRLFGEGRRFEAPTLTCSHCKTVVIVNPERTRERGYCRKCDHYVCDACAAAQVCRPFAQVVDDVKNGRTPVPLLATQLRG